MRRLKSNIAFAQAYQFFGLKYRDVGYGSRFAEWVDEQEDEPYVSYGNGSAMRVSFIADFFITKPIKNQNYGVYGVTDDSRAGGTEKYPTSILRYQKPHPSVAKHRTEKPVDLLEYLILTYTNAGETALDSCMGCGSTGVACVNTNRNFIGIELENNHFEIVKKRIETNGNRL